MKWLIIQSGGEHRGQDGWAPNWFLRECFSLQDALIRHGQVADVWGLRHDNYAATPDFNSYDAIFMAENYEFDWIPDLSTFRGLKFQWVIDLHHQGPDPYTKFARRFIPSMMLHATAHLMPDYANLLDMPVKHGWWPNAVDDRYFDLARYPKLSREVDCVFIGGIGTRKSAIETMRSKAGMAYDYGITGYNYINALRATKVAFNMPINRDINYRTFEAIGLGACLLTQADPDLQRLGFEHEQNCVLYQTAEQAAELSTHLVRSRDYERIAENGHKLLARHTYFARIGTLLDILV